MDPLHCSKTVALVKSHPAWHWIGLLVVTGEETSSRAFSNYTLWKGKSFEVHLLNFCITMPIWF